MPYITPYQWECRYIEKAQDALEIEIAELEKAVTGYEQSQKSAEKFIALIRAEDMKKGAFSTVGQLPKEEPRKGSIAASAAV